MEAHTHCFTWRGIQIKTAYTPQKWGAIAHLEILSVAPEGAPLPITATGYRSHFHPIGTIEAAGGDVVLQVIAWLDDEAAKTGWKSHAETACQLLLF